MKKVGLIVLCVSLCIFLVPIITSAAGPEDPYYRGWATSNVGSSVSLAGTADDSQGHSSFTQTITLKEFGNDHLVIQIARTENGKSLVKTKKVYKFGDATDRIEYLGQEVIVVAGKSFNCERYTLTLFDKSGKEMMKFAYWFHPDIPGAARIVSQSSYGSDSGLVTTKATQTAVSWDKK